ncbi:polyhydroxyalkanoic acid system family protein [Agriterribacter sp.]|uniref:polyhydroxyalkanoic acid system family protein n=1 Tax=Agriterribacter sp. TaxID=2821509 RepID=UPI002B53B5A6|nr:polyhydroxyalkanoic acid system family protein [Agriterribacter sp.]HTN06655.1 polyhydroxyalkanoic acid system family protein [Agriterribacter sp.]
MKIEIPHQHTKAEAQTRIKNLLQNLKEKYADKVNNVQENWLEDTGTFSVAMGPFSTSGSIVIKESLVEIDLAIPFIAGLYKNQIRGLIEAQAKEVLA